MKNKKKFELKKILLLLIIIFAALYVLMFVFHQFKPMPDGTSVEGGIYNIDADSVDFLYDVTYIDEDDERIIEQEIFDKVLEIIDGAEEFIVIDMFLFRRGDGYRQLATEMADKLIERKTANPEMSITLTTDIFNLDYGSGQNVELERLENSGIDVVITDMNKMRDSNLFYSPFWRVLFEPAGIPDSYEDCEGSLYKPRGNNYCIRSLMKLLNAKANHRKVIVADNVLDGERKIVSLITSANPDAFGSDYSNVALFIEDEIYKDIYFSEKKIAEFSSGKSFDVLPEVSSVEEGEVSVQLLTEGKIGNGIVKEIDASVQGEKIDIAMFLLTERRIIKSLLEASERGVDIRIVLDPSKYLFGTDSKGVPNVPVANELVRKSDGKIKVRWYDTHGEEFHSKMVVIRKNDGSVVVFLGSANLTRRNINNYNLELDVKLVANGNVGFAQEIFEYYERIWNNENGHYTLDFESFSDDSKWKYVKYRFQEASGLSAW
jgi:HKD family nuclease